MIGIDFSLSERSLSLGNPPRSSIVAINRSIASVCLSTAILVSVSLTVSISSRIDSDCCLIASTSGSFSSSGCLPNNESNNPPIESIAVVTVLVIILEPNADVIPSFIVSLTLKILFNLDSTVSRKL